MYYKMTFVLKVLTIGYLALKLVSLLEYSSSPKSGPGPLGLDGRFLKVCFLDSLCRLFEGPATCLCNPEGPCCWSSSPFPCTGVEVSFDPDKKKTIKVTVLPGHGFQPIQPLQDCLKVARN